LKLCKKSNRELSRIASVGPSRVCLNNKKQSNKSSERFKNGKSIPFAHQRRLFLLPHSALVFKRKKPATEGKHATAKTCGAPVQNLPTSRKDCMRINRTVCLSLLTPRNCFVFRVVFLAAELLLKRLQSWKIPEKSFKQESKKKPKRDTSESSSVTLKRLPKIKCFLDVKLPVRKCFIRLPTISTSSTISIITQMATSTRHTSSKSRTSLRHPRQSLSIMLSSRYSISKKPGTTRTAIESRLPSTGNEWDPRPLLANA
jgi:hypothetical protein